MKQSQGGWIPAKVVFEDQLVPSSSVDDVYVLMRAKALRAVRIGRRWWTRYEWCQDLVKSGGTRVQPRGRQARGRAETRLGGMLRPASTER